ncbi:MAG: hypothetical protein KDC35_13535 [Acidobacteria bacterium]|nr:hypothetical protein [Acidobacteriota bacterium]
MTEVAFTPTRDTTAPSSPGIIIEHIHVSDRSIFVSGTLCVDSAGDTSASAWVRSLTVIAITRANQVPIAAHLAPQRIIGDHQWTHTAMADGRPIRWIPFRFDVMKLLPHLPKEVIYLFVRSRMYTSKGHLIFGDKT